MSSTETINSVALEVHVIYHRFLRQPSITARHSGVMRTAALSGLVLNGSGRDVDGSCSSHILKAWFRWTRNPQATSSPTDIGDEEFRPSRYLCPSNKHKINDDNKSVCKGERKRGKAEASAGIQSYGHEGCVCFCVFLRAGGGKWASGYTEAQMGGENRLCVCVCVMRWRRGRLPLKKATSVFHMWEGRVGEIWASVH